MQWNGALFEGMECYGMPWNIGESEWNVNECNGTSWNGNVMQLNAIECGGMEWYFVEWGGM